MVKCCEMLNEGFMQVLQPLNLLVVKQPNYNDYDASVPKSNIIIFVPSVYPAVKIIPVPVQCHSPVPLFMASCISVQ